MVENGGNDGGESLLVGAIDYIRSGNGLTVVKEWMQWDNQNPEVSALVLQWGTYNTQAVSSRIVHGNELDVIDVEDKGDGEIKDESVYEDLDGRAIERVLEEEKFVVKVFNEDVVSENFFRGTKSDQVDHCKTLS